ncbi:MAG: dihydrofolate reductase family protein [Bacteroidota bacterium]
MKSSNHIFIATSLEGYIADANGGIGFLDTFPEINTFDSGYAAFTADIDALVMGRTTFQTVCSFDIDWPYEKPVFVLSNTLKSIPKKYEGKAHLVKGTLTEILDQIHLQGYKRLYIDGGATIQSFLKADLIDSMVLTIIPVLLGSGIPLFGELSDPLKFECFESKVYLNKIVQNHFRRLR